jgi:hypothetical protein
VWVPSLFTSFRAPPAHLERIVLHTLSLQFAGPPAKQRRVHAECSVPDITQRLYSREET